VEGQLTVRYTDGSEEETRAGDLFYWPPGHSVKVTKDAEIVLFSPQHEHGQVINHIQAKLSS
jgi:hypothetical protein